MNPKEIIITVTPADAQSCGRYGSGHDCLLATAVKRQTGHQVDCGGYTLLMGGAWFRIVDHSRILRAYAPLGFGLRNKPAVNEPFTVTLIPE